MTITLDDILSAARVGETDDWEFKRAKGGLPDAFWDTYSAMSNTDGGVVVLGVGEADGTYTFDGLTEKQIATCLKTLMDGLNNRSVVSRNLISADDVEAVPLGAARLLAVRIRAATRTERPVHRTQNPFGTTFRRAHEGDYRCTDDQVRRMLADAAPNGGDHRILDGYGFDDIDVPSLDQYRNMFSASNVGHPWLKLNAKDFLERLGGWRRDRSPVREGLTLAGTLMFGKIAIISAPEVARQYFVDYREKLNPAQRWTDRLIPDGRWEANLFQFYTRLWPKLTQDLKVPFRLEGVQRIDETDVHVALREAVVNALVHSDYSAPGGIVIERYRDRFVIENPGTLLVSQDQLRRGGVSECRNKALQVMFRMIGSGDQAGSGFGRIQAGWESQHWRAPALSTQTNPDRILLTLPMLSLLPSEALTALEGRFGARFRGLSKHEVLALVTAHLEEGVSNTRLQDLMPNHPDEIGHVLQGLCAKGLLTAVGKGRWTRYRLIGPGYVDLFADSGDANSAGLDADSVDLDGDSAGLPGDSVGLNGDSAGSGGESEDLEAIAAPVARVGKAKPALMRATILKLCKSDYRSLERLAVLLRRNRNNLRHSYLAPMVREGVLVLRYPHTPNRPDQSYRAASALN
jgi:ATP-dependent DNA helicase RecG